MDRTQGLRARNDNANLHRLVLSFKESWWDGAESKHRHQDFESSAFATEPADRGIPLAPRFTRYCQNLGWPSSAQLQEYTNPTFFSQYRDT